MSTIEASHLAAIDRLIALINTREEGTAAQRAAFREALEDADEEDLEDFGDDPAIWVLKDVIDWDTGFFVDWKDTESFIGAVDKLAQARGVSIAWGVEDPLDEEFLDSTDVPALMALAHGQLAAQGLTLWNWATDSDCYGGWIARSQDDAAMVEVSEQLGVRFRTGDLPF